MLHGGVARHDEHRLAKLLQRADQRIVFPENHLVIELTVHPPFDDSLDVGEVAHHVSAIQRAAGDFNFGNRVVAVRVLTDAVVIEQAVAVAELDTLRDQIHVRKV